MVKAKEAVEGAVEEVTEKKAKHTPITLRAKYKVIDRDGTKTFPEFVSEGDTVEEVLAGLEFPKGVNALVEVTVTRGDKSLMKALAPSRARLILENEQKLKATEALKAAFRGII